MLLGNVCAVNVQYGNFKGHYHTPRKKIHNKPDHKNNYNDNSVYTSNNAKLLLIQVIYDITFF